MIIRLTVGDNDFTEFMEGYLKYFLQRLLCCDFDKDVSSLTRDEIILSIQRHKKVGQLFNPNNSHKLSDENKEFIMDAVKSDFHRYVDEYSMTGLGIDKHVSDYLKSKFQVSILESFTDKWENGEAFYWLQHSNQVICQ